MEEYGVMYAGGGRGLTALINTDCLVRTHVQEWWISPWWFEISCIVYTIHLINPDWNESKPEIEMKIKGVSIPRVQMYEEGGVWARDHKVHEPCISKCSSLSAAYREHENIKRRAYEQRMREVEHASFTPQMQRLASLLSTYLLGQL